jgi:hypothetical protein
MRIQTGDAFSAASPGLTIQALPNRRALAYSWLHDFFLRSVFCRRLLGRQNFRRMPYLASPAEISMRTFAGRTQAAT